MLMKISKRDDKFILLIKTDNDTIDWAYLEVNDGADDFTMFQLNYLANKPGWFFAEDEHDHKLHGLYGSYHEIKK